MQYGRKGYKSTVLGKQYSHDTPYGDVRRRTVSEDNLNTPRLQREFNDRLEYFMEKYPSMDIKDARQEVMKQMAQDNGFMSRIDLMETARRGRPSDTQAGKRLMMGTGGMVKRYEEGGPIENGDPEKPSFFIAKGYDNRGDMPSGHEIAALFMRTPDGPKQINPKDLMEYFPEAKDVYEAYQQAGIPIKRTKTSDGRQGIMFPQLGDDGSSEGRRTMTSHNRALMQEFGVDNMDALRDTLNIAPVQYKRERDLPAIVPGYDPRSDM